MRSGTATAEQAHAAPFLSLVPPETNQPSPTTPTRGTSPYEPLTVSWRHRFWTERRQLVAEALERTGAHVGRRIRFAACGRNAWVYVNANDPEQVKLVSDQ